MEQSSGPRCGIILAAISGLLFSVWPIASSFVMGTSRFGNVVKSAKLEPTSFFILYATSALISCLILLPIFSKRPVHNGDPLLFWPNYLALKSATHFLGILGGFMHGLGTLLSLDAGKSLGNSVSISITRCQPLVCALWGVLLWGELQGARRGTLFYFVCMMMLFVAAVISFLFAGLSNS